MNPPLGVTCGDPAGIGLECFFKAWAERTEPSAFRLYANPRHIESTSHFLTGKAKELARASCSPAPPPGLELCSLPCDETAPPTPGLWNPLWGKVARESLERSISDALRGDTSGVLTLPITKRIVQDDKEEFPGQTELFASRCNTESFAMMLAGPDLRVVPVTTHIPIADVAHTLTATDIEEKIRILHHALRHDFGLSSPVIGICGLNPHAGEGGLLGKEEIEIIEPALKRCREEGMTLRGPVAADTLFPLLHKFDCDAILSMYHDQGLIPFKLLHFADGVNTTIGLPIVRTSPDHGVAYDLAGKNRADPRSTGAAIRMAQEMYTRRKSKPCDPV